MKHMKIHIVFFLSVFHLECFNCILPKYSPLWIFDKICWNIAVAKTKDKLHKDFMFSILLFSELQTERSKMEKELLSKTVVPQPPVMKTAPAISLKWVGEKNCIQCYVCCECIIIIFFMYCSCMKLYTFTFIKET